MTSTTVRPVALVDLPTYRAELCQAFSKQSGGQCQNYPSKGGKVCRYHGGATKRAKDKAQRVLAEREASKAVAKWGLPVDTTPSEALLDEVRWSATHVQYLRNKVAELADDDLVFGTTREVWKPTGLETTSEAAVSVWYQLYIKEREHLVRVCEAAVRAGVEQRRVELAEQQGLLVATVLRRTLDALYDNLAEAGVAVGPVWGELVATIVPRELRALEAGGYDPAR